MRSLRHLLPSAGGLIVFEAAARHRSFTAAGDELGISQAAVSYAIRNLEDHLGVKLFSRGHRRVSLTEAGARFFADVALGLSHIRRSAEDLRALASERHVTLSASTAFANFWMMPRLQQFREELADIELRLQTADRDLDLVAEGIPLGIRGGRPEDWPDYDCAVLAPERISPVAGRLYVEKHGAPEDDTALVDHRLIHLDEPFRVAATWNDWFASAGIARRPASRGLVINDYVLVIQAVLEGQGIALGWHHLAERMIERGLLVRVGRHMLETDSAFHIVWPRDRPLAPGAQRVRDWLIALGREERP